MKQYCRYCAFCFEADDFRCSNHPKGQKPHWSREQINKENHCKNFVLSDLGDVETGRHYSPRRTMSCIRDEFEQIAFEAMENEKQ